MNSNKIKSFFDYNDDYPTCDSTYATLCIYLPDNANPTALSEKLNIQPSRLQTKGEIRNGKVKNWPTAWFLETSDQVQSKDVRRHINWLLEHIEDQSDIIKQLQNTDTEVHISCFWASATGHGGPMLDQDILKRISNLNIGISFDIYFAGDQINEIFNEKLKAKNRA
jgi:hypothetical protein